MISEFIYSNDTTDSSLYYYDEDFLYYYVCKKLSENGPSSTGEIKKWIIDRAKISNINNSRFSHFIFKFKPCGKSWYLFEKEISCLELTKRFESNLFFMCCDKKDDLYKSLCSFIGQTQFNVSRALPFLLAIHKIEFTYDDEFYASCYFNTLQSFNSNYLKIDYAVSNIVDCYQNFTLDFIFADKFLLDIFFANGINTVKDLSELSVESLMVIFSVNLEENIKFLSQLSTNFSITYKNKVNDFYNRLDDRQKEILNLRNGFIDGRKYVLEEIGIKLDLTRERVRQIEAKATEKLCKDSKYLIITYAGLYFSIIKSGQKYITKNSIDEYINDSFITNILLFILSNSEAAIKYDTDLEIMYNSNLISINEIADEIVDIYGNIIIQDEFNCMDEFEKKIVARKYRPVIDDAVFLLRGIPERRLMVTIIEDLFPHGYHISDEKAFLEAKNEYVKRYRVWNDNIDSRIVGTYLERDDFCQCDKGTYICRSLAVKIPPSLLDKIINYISFCQPFVFYESVFTHFKNELMQLGVNNYYYLKGIIDPYLPDEFNTKRNYIQTGTIRMSSSDSIKQFMQSFNTYFTLDDLKNRFEGVKDYTLYNMLYCEQDNGLVWVSSKKFIYLNKTGIGENEKNRLNKFIHDLYKLLNTKVLSSRKIYSRLAFTNRELLNKLNIVNDQYSLFSLLRALYKDELFFYRPIIAVDKESCNSQDILIRDYASKLEKFSLNIIKNYISKLSLRGLYSYLDFMEDMSDEFVQINMDTMVKKGLLHFDETKKKAFIDLFDLIFAKFESVDTRTFNGYAMLPNLDYKWNKYLLVGVIRSFFLDQFEIQNTDNMYNQADFIIKKII